MNHLLNFRILKFCELHCAKDEVPISLAFIIIVLNKLLVIVNS